MNEETSMPAETPAAEHTQPAAAPAEHHQEHYQEQPADSPAEETYYEEPAEEHEEPDGGEDEGDQPKRKKLSGAARAKAQREYFQNELSAREQRIAELERYIGERDENDRQSEGERRAEAQRKRDEAHLERIKGAKGAITDFDRVMSKMRGVAIHEDLIEEIKASDKSPLLTYHLAKNPEKLRELNHMSERDRAREIGRLEGTLKMPEGRKQTKAPPPPSTLRGGASPHTPLEQVGDMGTFAKRLLADLDKRSGRRPGR
jgi:hypothetical protein